MIKIPCSNEKRRAVIVFGPSLLSMKRNLMKLNLVIWLVIVGFGYNTATASSSVLDSFDVPGSFPTGLAWDGNNLWINAGFFKRVAHHERLIFSKIIF